MIKYILICNILFSPLQVCNAIYKAEGGAKAQYLYGIKSVHYSNANEAKEICIRTIKHKWSTYEKDGRKGAFIDYLRDKYAPLSAAKVNANWKKNVLYFLLKEAKK